MMFGFRDEFEYFQCAVCKCLQISAPPADMARYYPGDYYSYSTHHTKNDVKRIRRAVEEMRNRYWADCNITTDSRILDVGCGSGASVYALKECGYANAAGIDPYIEKDITYENGAVVLKRTIHDCDQLWDLIIFNHSFEHLADPLETLQGVKRLLSGDGVCLIRMPTTSSYAWEQYGIHWVQLDAPRHFFLHSLESLEIISAKSGLRLGKVLFDSTEFQFLGSEMYLRDIPLHSKANIFSAAEIIEYKTRSVQLNLEGRGDQAAFYLTAFSA